MISYPSSATALAPPPPPPPPYCCPYPCPYCTLTGASPPGRACDCRIGLRDSTPGHERPDPSGADARQGPGGRRACGCSLTARAGALWVRSGPPRLWRAGREKRRRRPRTEPLEPLTRGGLGGGACTRPRGAADPARGAPADRPALSRGVSLTCASSSRQHAARGPPLSGSAAARSAPPADVRTFDQCLVALDQAPWFPALVKRPALGSQVPAEGLHLPQREGGTRTVLDAQGPEQVPPRQAHETRHVHRGRCF